MANKKQAIVLVTGGSGFLGKNIVQELLEPECPIDASEIRVFDIHPYSGIQDKRVNFTQGDIQNYDALNDVCKGVTVVMHTAAIIDWGTKSREEILAVNVGGTENVIKACLNNKVLNLVYTSSLDAVFTGQPLVDIDENQSYPTNPVNSYCESKILSEKLVVEAGGEDLKTCILRPSDIYGEQDPYHIDSLIDMAKSGFYIRLGNGKAKCQHVYVRNMAHAHILAAKALLQNNTSILGKAYLITDGPGENFFTFFDQVVIGAGYRIFPKNLWLPKNIAYFFGTVSEFMAWLVRPIKKYYPKFSRFAVIYTCTDFTFKTNRAKDDFGWAPKYSTKEAVEKTIDYYKRQKEK